MRKLIATLAFSTSALAATSIYLWTELRDARGQVEVLSAYSPTKPATLQAHTPDGAEPAKTAAVQSSAGSDVPSSPNDDEKARQELFEKQWRDNSRRMLAQLADPMMRAEMLEELKSANRANEHKYVRHLGISEADARRLIDLLANLELAQSEAYARCLLQTRCDHQSLRSEASAAKQQAITDLLGAEVQQRFDQYMYTDRERQMVSSFLRDKIPASSQLTDEQAEQLVAALADERKSIETEIRQRGLEPHSWSMEGVAFTFSGSFLEPGNATERLKEGADFNRRIHARAKAILTPPQLAAFEQMQEQATIYLKSMLRRQERDHATQAMKAGEGR
jgi:hypothetical protein